MRMWERLKSWMLPGGRRNAVDMLAVERWVETKEWAFERLPAGQDFALAGQWDGVPWRLERTGPGREFIVDAELRARAELGVPEDLAIMLINRPLKESLEQRGYRQATHGIQTTVDADLPEELRWLAMYDEVGWSTAPIGFWDHYAIVADTRAHAQQWLDRELVSLLQAWPTPAVQQMTPFILQLQRGRVYLRMEYPQADLATLEHAVAVLRQACASARHAWRVEV